MSVGVISTMAASGASSTASAAANTASGSEVSGEFAALLSGELKNLLRSTREDDPMKASSADLDASTLLDPALIASLTGNPQFLPENNRGDGAFLTPEQTEKDSARMLAINNGQAGAVFSKLDRTTTSVGFGEFEKTGLASSNAALSPGGAANIAGEPAAQETNASTLSSSMLALAAGKQLPEAQSAQQHNVSTPLRDASWPQQFGEKLVWLAKNDQQTAQININPPQLGPVQITINLSGDQASLAFASPHSEVRQAIESALPQLKELLSSAGINLGQANVGANLAHQNPNPHSSQANGNRLANENAILRANDNAASAGVSAILQRGRGLVDLFA